MFYVDVIPHASGKMNINVALCKMVFRLNN